MENSINQEIMAINRCLRYALMPNYLHFCGPEKQADFLEFQEKVNAGKKIKHPIKSLLEQFETLFPYLKLIAKYNNYQNPLSEKIIEAYWLGNEVLTKVTPRHYYNFLNDELEQKKKLNQKEFNNFFKKFDLAVLPHHNFHVFSLARRTGKMPIYHTLATIDLCRISWGKVKKINNDQLIVISQPLAINNQGKIYEADFIEKKITNNVNGVKLISDLKEGDYVSLHWGSACEKLNINQVKNLQYYTNLAIKYAINLSK